MGFWLSPSPRLFLCDLEYRQPKTSLCFFFFFCRDPGTHPATLPAGAVLVLAAQADTKPRGLLRDVWAG